MHGLFSYSQTIKKLYTIAKKQCYIIKGYETLKKKS